MQTTWTLPLRPARVQAPNPGRRFEHAGTTPNVVSNRSRYETAYRATLYQVHAERTSFDLRIDIVSERLAALMRRHGVTTAAYLTAFNPYSERLSDVTNRAANEQLRAALVCADAFIFDGDARDPGGQWPAESSFLALGIAFATARDLGVQFKQNAILFADDDAMPRLVCLPRHRITNSRAATSNLAWTSDQRSRIVAPNNLVIGGTPA